MNAQHVSIYPQTSKSWNFSVENWKITNPQPENFRVLTNGFDTLSSSAIRESAYEPEA